MSVIRIVDNTKQLADDAIKKTFFDLNVEKSSSITGGMIWYFMVDGFLVVFHFSPEENIHAVRAKRNYAQITNRQKLVVPIADISNFRQLYDGFSSMAKQAVEF